jgi:hypothetical protein
VVVTFLNQHLKKSQINTENDSLLVQASSSCSSSSSNSNSNSSSSNNYTKCVHCLLYNVAQSAFLPFCVPKLVQARSQASVAC